MKKQTFNQRECFLLRLLIATGVIRLTSLGLYPLSDSTEARYSEIARLMATTGNWITPQIDYGVPFWAKPPLSTWMSAASFNIFGINEFAARLPSFVLGAMVVVLIFLWSRQLKGNEFALASAVILATTAVFFISSGAVMTDPALLLGTTLSMVSFYQAIKYKQGSFNHWGYLFFVGLAISLLAKGPVGLVMTLLPTGVWVMMHQHWRTVFQQLPWVRGLILTGMLSLPWYLLAESQTPGFLEYFFVGEHWNRFVDSGWKGDLYGKAHARTRGTIWFYWLVSSLPWSVVIVSCLFSRRGRSRTILRVNENLELSSYLLAWTLTPMVFFTLAGNILWTYVLSGVPAFSMLVALFLLRSESAIVAKVDNRNNAGNLIQNVAASMAFIFALVLILGVSGVIPKRKSQKELIEAYESIKSPDDQLVYLCKRPHSAQFYSSGTALYHRKGELLTPEQTRSYLPQDGDNQELTSDHQTDQVSKKGFIPC